MTSESRDIGAMLTRIITSQVECLIFCFMINSQAHVLRQTHLSRRRFAGNYQSHIITFDVSANEFVTNSNVK